ncbi:MgtC/SapB family protein [Pyruvatibacter mobilis]|uniref:MgtC/SapB family protein n=1 Tax=Pyruvatibacter mobilis TaxID=1712261 RepID=UPI003BB149D1
MPGFTDMAYIPLWEACLRVLLSAGAAMLIGYERQYKKKPLDLRPFTLISVGSCLAVLTVMETAYTQTDSQLTIDPTRVISGVLGGIGFLGAGALFRASGEVHGGATAASIWVMGVIGVAFGLGAYPLAVLATVLALVTLLMGGFMSNRAGSDADKDVPCPDDTDSS